MRAIEDRAMLALVEQLECAETSLRAAVEHLCRMLKRQFAYAKASYKMLAKNGVLEGDDVGLWVAYGTYRRRRAGTCIFGDLT